MGVSHKWLKIVRMKFLRSSNNKHKTLPRTNVCTNQNEEAILGRNEPTTTTITREDEHFNLAIQPADPLSILTKEDAAAIKIQSYFRGHLARRAYGALKSLVKLQALVRGVFVRKQSRIAMHCMHALVRLQVKIRARQLLGSFDHN